MRVRFDDRPLEDKLQPAVPGLRLGQCWDGGRPHGVSFSVLPDSVVQCLFLMRLRRRLDIRHSIFASDSGATRRYLHIHTNTPADARKWAGASGAPAHSNTGE